MFQKNLNGLEPVMLKGCWAAPYATDSTYMKAYRHRFDIRGGANDEMLNAAWKAPMTQTWS